MTSLSLYKPYRLPITQYRHERPVKMVPEVSTKYKRQRATESANRWKKTEGRQTLQSSMICGMGLRVSLECPTDMIQQVSCYVTY